MRELDDITGAIVDASLRIHRALGPGLLESVYEAVLARALERRGLRVERQKVIRFAYEGMVFEEGFRADLVVDDRVIVEVKSVDQLARAHPKQLLTYLKLSNRQVGLLINFGAPTLREGLRRIVNGFQPSAPSRLRVNQSVEMQAVPPGHPGNPSFPCETNNLNPSETAPITHSVP
ncbi:MAG TPA: GxxExxY protein [Gemmatimonadales bacterium]